MHGWMLRSAFCLALLSNAPPARSWPADVSSIGTPRNLVLVQQQQPPAGNDIVAELDRMFREIGQLRQSIAKVFGGPNELAAVPDLAREVALGEKAIRSARH